MTDIDIDIDIDKLINMNYRILTLLGYATALLHDFCHGIPESEKKQYYWFMQAMENVMYLDKPLPPMP